MDIGIISGSGFYDLDISEREKKDVETPYGTVPIVCGTYSGAKVAFVSRHGEKHSRLSNMVNHRANIWALHSLGVKLIVGCSVCGVLTTDIELGKLLLFNDLFFPDNRLDNGELCTFFTTEGDKKRGHLICGSHFNHAVLAALESDGVYPNITYAHVNGPRFNSKSEIRFFSQYAHAVSQTAGPEAVLCGELEIPYVLLGFGIDYANGVSETPTPIEVLTENLNKSKKVFVQALQKILALPLPQFEGFVYRFE